MNPALSIYLDLVRFGAALVVVLAHAWPVVEPRHPLPWPGHHAVVVFFVLSGIVITHATTKRAIDAREYAVHRLARLWSVAVPALLLGAAVCQIDGLEWADDTALLSAGFGKLLARSFANLAFMAQVWGVDAQPPLNAPFWSLNYEAWYYVLFGIWLYVPGRLRLACLLAVAAVVGPRILLLLPIWLMGVAVYRLAPSVRVARADATAVAGPPVDAAARRRREAAGLAVFLLTMVLALAWIQGDLSSRLRALIDVRWPDLSASLHASSMFAGDSALGVIVSLHFAAVPSLGRFARPLLWLQRPIRVAASYTLSAYLYHMPLLVLLWSGLGLQSRWVYLPLAILIVGLGRVTEHQLAAAQALLRWLLAVGRRAVGRRTGGRQAGGPNRAA